MIHARKDYMRIQDLAAVAKMLDEAIAAIGEDCFEGQSLVVFKEQLEARYGPLTGVEPIPEDELVFMVRSGDETAPDTVRWWSMRAASAGASDRMVRIALHHADAMEAQQRERGKKVPDLPEDAVEHSGAEHPGTEQTFPKGPCLGNAGDHY